jgi:1-aminocyclopropane-1-carboxylate deaminase/D-cysteine desulfhydrase-like pyridoxal-dependent ACC family enzyme
VVEHYLDTVGVRGSKPLPRTTCASYKDVVLPPSSAATFAALRPLARHNSSNRRVDHVVFASSSGGTQAGIVVDAKVTGFDGKLHGVSIDTDERDSAPYDHELADIANETAKYVGFNAQFTANDFNVSYEYLGGGYGVVSDLEREAIRLLGSREGIVLDPVYTGRAMGALIDLIRKKTFRPDETVLFWHTGGAPALFAYAKDLI